MNEFCDMTDEANYRERAIALLDEFAQQAREVLRDAGIGIDLIFVVPPTGDVILTFGVAAELYSEEWKAIRATVSSLVRRWLGWNRPSAAMSSVRWDMPVSLLLIGSGRVDVQWPLQRS